ncbi:hypothetical protein BE221DRAFT_170754, partial [Ostreococcus tauri]
SVDGRDRAAADAWGVRARLERWRPRERVGGGDDVVRAGVGGIVGARRRGSIETVGRWRGGRDGGAGGARAIARVREATARGAEGARGVIETPGLDRRARRESDEEDEEEDDEQREESQGAYVSRGSEERFDAVEGEGSEEVDEGGYATPIREEASE